MNERVSKLNVMAIMILLLISYNSITQAQHDVQDWRGQDLGVPVLPGSFSTEGGVMTINAAGYDIWSTYDEGYFVFQELTGDGEIIARVSSIQNTDDWVKAGVMIRESLSINSAFAYSLVAGTTGIHFNCKTNTGVEARDIVGVP